MTHSPFWGRRPTDADLKGLLDSQSRLPLTYESVGMTGDGHAVDGYRAVCGTVDLGHGQRVFEQAVRSIQGWKVHEQAGLHVISQDATAMEGTCAVLLIRLSVAYVTVACRVVSTISTDDRWGFAYGTLPHHVERGEELFLVERTDDGRVHFTVRALSRPGHFLTAVGAPVARIVQRTATSRYLRAMVDLVPG